MASHAHTLQIVECVQGEVKASANSTRSTHLDWQGWMIVSFRSREVSRPSGWHSRHLRVVAVSIKAAYIGEHSAVELKLV
jgi:hypothetical protein